MAISLRKRPSDQLAEIIPIRPLDYSDVEETMEIPTVKPAREVFGPLRYGLLPGSTVTGSLPRLHNHGLPAVSVMHLSEKPTDEPVEVSPFDETVSKHRLAAKIQRVRNVMVWYGEHTEEFWVMDDRGLHSFATLAEMYAGMKW